MTPTTVPALPLYDYLPEHQAIIYQVCGVAVPSCLAYRYLQETHHLSAWDRRLQLNALLAGIQP
jgi:hypothetical protein